VLGDNVVAKSHEWKNLVLANNWYYIKKYNGVLVIHSLTQLLSVEIHGPDCYVVRRNTNLDICVCLFNQDQMV
jgi:hypothetical protein